MKQFLDGLFCLAVGAGFCAAAAFSRLRTRRFVEEAARAFGEVVGLKAHDGDGTTCAPVVRFPLPGGRVAEFAENTSGNPPTTTPATGSESSTGPRTLRARGWLRARTSTCSRSYSAPPA